MSRWVARATGLGVAGLMAASLAALIVVGRPTPVLSVKVSEVVPLTAQATDHQSFRMTISLSERIARGAMDLKMAGQGTGEFDLTSSLGDLEIPTTITGSSPSHLELRMVYAPGHVYTQVTTGPEAGKWIQTPAVGPFSGIGSLADPAALRTMLHSNPLVTDLGPTSVRGVPTEHYTMASPGPVGGSIRMAPIGLWVDSTGRVRRIQVSFHTLAGHSGMSLSAEVSVDLFDFGATVQNMTPPARNIVSPATSGLLPITTPGSSG